MELCLKVGDGVIIRLGVALGRGQDPTLRKFLGEPSVLACDEDVRPTER